MAANTLPIFTKTPNVGGKKIVTAPTTVYDTSGTIATDIYLLFQAGANGSFVDRIRFKYTGNGTTASNLACVRIWLSSVNTGTPVAGTSSFYIDEIALPVTPTINTTTVNEIFEIPLGFAIPANWTVLGIITVSQPANFGWLATCFGADY